MGGNLSGSPSTRIDALAESDARKAANAAVELSHVSFSYGASPVLTDASLHVNKGEMCMIVGENGAGKSTLLSVMLGELAPTTGEAKLFGSPAQSFRDWRRIGYVPQCVAGTYERFPATIAEVVAANRYAARKGFPPRSKKDSDAVSSALASVGMQDYSKRLIGELSGGQTQRVLLARALVNHPDLLVLDEPTSGMDSDCVEAFMKLLKTIMASKKCSVVIVTHDTRRLSSLPAHVLRLESGRINRIDEHENALKPNVDTTTREA